MNDDIKNQALRELLHSLSNDVCVVRGMLNLAMKRESTKNDDKLKSMIDKALTKSNDLCKKIDDLREQNR